MLDPRWYGRPSTPGSFGGWIRAGLIALDTTTGATRVYTDADGLPLVHFADVFYDYGLRRSIGRRSWFRAGCT